MRLAPYRHARYRLTLAQRHEQDARTAWLGQRIGHGKRAADQAWTRYREASDALLQATAQLALARLTCAYSVADNTRWLRLVPSYVPADALSPCGRAQARRYALWLPPVP